MANRLPKSWSTCGAAYLSTITTLPAPFLADYGGIYWQECVGSYSETDARLSADQPSAAHVCYYTQMESITNQAVQNIFFRSILGGYDRDTDMKWTPLQHPYYSYMWAKDIISIQPVSPEEVQENTTGIRNQFFEEYNLCKVEVSFETLTYLPCKLSDMLGGGWTTTTVKTTNSRITQLFGGYILNDSSVNGIPWKLGNQLIRPEGIVTRTYYRTPGNWLYNNLNSFIGLQGKVNNAAAFGYPTGCLLFDSFNFPLPWRDWEWPSVGDLNATYITNVILNFIYVNWGNDTGWNYQPKPNDPTDTWPVVSSRSPFTTPPFATADFSAFDSLLLPSSKVETCA